MDAGQVAGIATLVARHGKIVNVHLHGNKHTAGDPITRDTIYRMYSQTKPMTGVAMMILYEKGLWKLDDPERARPYLEIDGEAGLFVALIDMAVLGLLSA